MTSVRYLCETLKIFKMNNIIILVKKINSSLTVTIDFNGSMLVKKIIIHQKGRSKFRKWAKTKLYNRDRDWPVQTVGITRVRENFIRDRGIEEPYRGSPFNLTSDLYRISPYIISTTSSR